MNTPKYTLDTLVKKANYYVVEQGGRYHYFPIKAETSGSNDRIFWLTKRPPVVMEGVAILGRGMYNVSLPDLLRGIVRSSSKVSPERVNASKRRNGSAANPASSDAPDSGSSADTGACPCHSESTDLYDCSSSGRAELEVDEAADATWQRQADALLYSLYQKEGGEWVLEEAVQP